MRGRRGVGRAPEYGHAILPVGSVPVQFDGVPADGAQYLAMVRYVVRGASTSDDSAEASSQPHTMVWQAPPTTEKEHARAAVPAGAPLAVPAEACAGREAPAADRAMPTAPWRTVFLERFARLHRRSAKRARLSPPQWDEARWCEHIHGHHVGCAAVTSPSPSTESTPDDDDDAYDTASSFSDGGETPGAREDEASPPSAPLHGYRFRDTSVALISRMDTDHTLKLLQMLRKWIQQPHFTASSRTALHPAHAQWIFFLLARLDRRLTGEQIAVLRSLARTCAMCIIRLRGARARALAPDAVAMGADTLKQESGAWVVVTIVAGVWGQTDLWEETRRQVASEDVGGSRMRFTYGGYRRNTDTDTGAQGVRSGRDEHDSGTVCAASSATPGKAHG
ncbi:hypothetical protein MSPP1_003548 [Malassezia sp. CBS 17886]|nr:hypothetical protein MSPP1_003548 [Malassezia sp. CBS 17886]